MDEFPQMRSIFAPPAYMWRIRVPGYDPVIMAVNKPNFMRRAMWWLLFGITWEKIE
jgi:hypothetical protein